MSFDIKYCEQIIQTYQKHAEQEGTIFIVSDYLKEDDFGKYVCALSNYAAYKKYPYVYAIWGINPENREIVGTDFDPSHDLQYTNCFSLRADYSTLSINKNDVVVTVLEVQRSISTTTQYNGVEYWISNNIICELKEHPEEEKALWKIFEEDTSFEIQPAKNNVSSEEVLALLDCKKLFEMLEIPYPNNPAEKISKLVEMRFVCEKNTGKYVITNLGALLLANRLKHFDAVEYKAIRVIQYDGNDVTAPAFEQIGGKGYIVGFSGLIRFIIDKLPSREIIVDAVRKRQCVYPELAIRELVANALIHQDLSEKGSPVISIFKDHIEITNPGKPLINLDRFIDHPSYSRNESLATAMRKVGICEERGSGYDKIISAVESRNLPVPVISEYEKSTKVSLFCKQDFDSYTKDEKIAACYAHVCLNYVQCVSTTNATLRKRFRLEENDRYKLSRVFSDTVSSGLIKTKEGTGMKNREYVPYWIKSNSI